jgi:hypothetical protein
VVFRQSGHPPIWTPTNLDTHLNTHLDTHLDTHLNANLDANPVFFKVVVAIIMQLD